MPDAANERPLAGLRVVDLTQVVSGAVTTMFLADFGADVVKVEPLDGEAYRNSGYALGEDGDRTNLNALRWTRGKRSIALDLKSPAGQDVLRRLIAKADVLVENFRPGVMERLGFGTAELEAINPGLIYATVSGFGHDDLFESPYRDRPAYALITEAMAGLTHLAGDGEGPPVWMGFAMADIFAGTLSLAGIALALLDRRADDPGRRVDVAMYDGALFMNDLAIALQTIVGETLGPGQYLLQSPWGPFATSDGHVVLAVLAERQWQGVCTVIGRPDLAGDARLASGRDRSRHHDALVEPAVTAWCRQRTKAECTEAFLAAGVPAAPVNTTADLVDCPQIAAREMLVEASAPAVGTVRVVGNPIKLGGRTAAGAAVRIPQLGADTVAVLRDDLGLTEHEVATLERDGVVRSS